MLTTTAPDTDDSHYLHLAQKAWEMWHKATEIADSLWNEFEPYFIDKCMEKEDNDYFSGNANLEMWLDPPEMHEQ